MSLEKKQNTYKKVKEVKENEKHDLSKNILNNIRYLIDKRLSNLNLNKIDNIYENLKSLMNEYETQNNKLNNKVCVLENLLILINKDVNDIKKKIKNKNIINETIDNINLKKNVSNCQSFNNLNELQSNYSFNENDYINNNIDYIDETILNNVNEKGKLYECI